MTEAKIDESYLLNKMIYEMMHITYQKSIIENFKSIWLPFHNFLISFNKKDDYQDLLDLPNKINSHQDVIDYQYLSLSIIKNMFIQIHKSQNKIQIMISSLIKIIELTLNYIYDSTSEAILSSMKEDYLSYI